jgi:hypothetical protein
MKGIPTPDRAPPDPIDGQELVEVIYSSNGSSRALLALDTGSLYRIYVDHWNLSYWYEKGFAFWTRNGPYSFTSSLDEARCIAQQYLDD